MHCLPVEFETRNYAASERMAPHRHPGFYLCHVERGGLVDRTASGVRFVAQAQSFLRRPDETHSNTFDPSGARCVIVRFNDAWLRACGIGRDDVRAEAILPAPHVSRLISLGSSGQNGPVEHLLLQATTLELLAMVISSEKAGRKNREAYLAAIEAAADDTEVIRDARGWLRRSGLSRSALDRQLRDAEGLTFSQFVRRERIRHAIRKIRETADSFAAIACDCGFADQAHLSREVKRHLGATPSQVRKIQSRQDCSSQTGKPC